jgi:hypothetical protein
VTGTATAETTGTATATVTGTPTGTALGEQTQRSLLAAIFAAFSRLFGGLSSES